MSEHLNIVLSRLRNMLSRITAEDADFDDLCAQHARITAEIRKLNPDVDPAQADQATNLRRRRAAMEDKMFAIMQANTRV
ncbi:MAG TPA: hypothetical protein VGA50_02535 [Kiloniellales bacterium]